MALKNQARDERILGLFAETPSPAVIARRMNLSKGAVAGVLHRHGLTVSRATASTTIDIFERAAVAEAVKAVARVEPALDVVRQVKVEARSEKKPRTPTRHSAPKIVTVRALPASFGVAPEIDTRKQKPAVRAVMGLRSAACHFPIGDPKAEFRYCGRPATVQAGGATMYCADCARRMYQPTVKSAAHRPEKPSASDRHFIRR